MFPGVKWGGVMVWGMPRPGGIPWSNPGIDTCSSVSSSSSENDISEISKFKRLMHSDFIYGDWKIFETFTFLASLIWLLIEFIKGTERNEVFKFLVSFLRLVL